MEAARYYVNQSGDPNDARGPTGARIVQELPEKNFVVGSRPICRPMIPKGSDLVMIVWKLPQTLVQASLIWSSTRYPQGLL